jgi:hypothetical protein
VCGQRAEERAPRLARLAAAAVCLDAVIIIATRIRDSSSNSASSRRRKHETWTHLTFSPLMGMSGKARFGLYIPLPSIPSPLVLTILAGSKALRGLPERF